MLLKLLENTEKTVLVNCMKIWARNLKWNAKNEDVYSLLILLCL